MTHFLLLALSRSLLLPFLLQTRTNAPRRFLTDQLAQQLGPTVLLAVSKVRRQSHQVTTARCRFQEMSIRPCAVSCEVQYTSRYLDMRINCHQSPSPTARIATIRLTPTVLDEVHRLRSPKAPCFRSSTRFPRLLSPLRQFHENLNWFLATFSSPFAVEITEFNSVALHSETVFLVCAMSLYTPLSLLPRFPQGYPSEVMQAWFPFMRMRNSLKMAA